LVATLTLSLTLAGTSCSYVGTTMFSLGGGRSEAPPIESPGTTIPAPTPPPTLDLQKVKPNELGDIPILEFHQIADAEEDQWSITPDHFRQTLQQLYDAGYRPISLNELLDNHIDVPAGTSPVVLTFDDSSPGQFRFVEKDGQAVVDPNSAVGMLEAFHAAHPDFAAKATFNVLPEAAEPNKLFGQPQYETQKLQYLVQHGFEIGNHTYWHQRLDEVDDQGVQKQLALAVKEIDQAVPGYRVRALALPLGLWPENRHLALSGSYQGVSYHNDAILLVGSDPAPSPNADGFDPQALERVQVFDHHLDGWLTYLSQHPDELYVSDGDPNTITFPSHLKAKFNADSAGSRTVRTY
jgi:peptidoglycan/xylan/chitin deacetylase (PgdA/CDA1 family)